MRMYRSIAAAGALLAFGCSSDSEMAPGSDDMSLEMAMPSAMPGAAGSAAPRQQPPGEPASDDDSAPGEPATPSEPAAEPSEGNAGDPSDPTTAFADLPEDCRGFEVRGLQHSPGGDTLPNTCAPFDRLRNNPYAIRCVDADPAYETGWPGDEMCILPPAPENGTQVAVTPASYESPEDGFVLEPGEEVTDYYYTNAPNSEQHYFYRVNSRMRAGSHHMINRMVAEREDGWSATGSNGSFGGGGNSRSFPGAQRPDQDRPHGLLEIPPENAGLGDVLEANQQFSLNLHHFNLTDEPTLREVWINIWYKPAGEVTEEIGGIAVFGNPADMNIAPGEHRVLHYQCDVPGPSRILTLNGHRHANTARFGVWLERNGEEIPLYESFDYNDMPTYNYDSISDNPVPDREVGIDGAFSGVLEVDAGDRIHFVCDVTNNNDVPLRFANEVQTGEMCILFGSRVGGPACGRATRVE